MSRKERRLTARNSGRCDNSGNPMFANIVTKQDKEDFDTLRHNKKMVKIIKFMTKNHVGYTVKGMKEANKVLKTPNKYNSKDVRTATRMVKQLGQYPNLFCIDDYFNKLRMINKPKIAIEV